MQERFLQVPGSREVCAAQRFFCVVPRAALCTSLLSLCVTVTFMRAYQVIVGVNGSGKSTILKLIVRLYDPDEGQILIGGHDIRTLKLYDLRQAISVLFQDFTHFPLSVGICRVSLYLNFNVDLCEYRYATTLP